MPIDPPWPPMTPDALRASVAEHEADARKAALDAQLEQEHQAWAAQNIDRAGLRLIKPPAPLIGGNLLYTGTTAWLTGAPGTYKSFIALDWALCIATGTAWLGRPVTQGRVLYFAGEGRGGFDKRVQAWQDNRKVTDEEIGDQIMFRGPADLVRGSDRENLLWFVDTYPHALVVIDTQSRMTPGASENDKDAMDPFIGLLSQVASEYGATTLTAHHDTKSGGRLRGSGSIEGAADTVLQVTREADTQLRVALRVEKQKDTESGEIHDLELLEFQDSLVVTNGLPEEIVHSGNQISMEVMKKLEAIALTILEEVGNGGITRPALRKHITEEATASRISLAPRTAYLVLNNLLDKSHVVLLGGSGPQLQGAVVTATAAGRTSLEWYRQYGYDPKITNSDEDPRF